MKAKTILLSLTLLLATAPAAQAQEKLPAFPGAEGFGRYVTGGRGGKVLHVKNLKDAGYQSLRWCLQQTGAKTIVFDVSGTIHLESALSIPSNTTVAGQTAPGDGICIADYPVTISGNNVIVRYMRFRLGNKNVKKDGADGWDGFGGYDKMDWMIDHCSVSWSIDECLSVLGNKNTTVQWCLVAQSLVNAGHSKGAHGYGGNWGGSGASFHHNLIAHHGSRTPRLGPRPTTQLEERMDMRNNVIYNFGGNGCYGGEGMTVNIVNNFYKPGPGSPTGTKGKRIAGIGIRTNSYVETYKDYAPALHLWGKYYVTGNYNSQYSDVNDNNWKVGILDQVDAGGCDGTWTQATKDSIKLEEPMPFIYTTTHTAGKAFGKVLNFAGASLHRDTFDEMIVNDTRNGKASHTGSGLSSGFINSQNDNKPAGADSSWSAWPTLESKEAPTDTDQDGIPDEWETANGLNPNDKNDYKNLNEEGYTMLEVYINSLVADITEEQNAEGEPMGYTINVGETTETKYEISGQTSNDDWSFSGGFKMNQTGAPATGSNGTIKYSANKQYKLTLPNGISFASAQFYGYSNADNATSYLSEVCGTVYDESVLVLPARNADPSSTTHTVQFPAPISGTFTFTAKGSQTCLKITLFVAQTQGIEDARHATMSNSHTVYDLQGRHIKSESPYSGHSSLRPGIYIVDGKKVIIR